MMNQQDSTKTYAYLALGMLCIIWGTTYTAIKISVDFFPPYLLVGLRQTSAGVVILLVAWATGALLRPETRAAMTSRYIFWQAVAGISMITGGNGFVTWGMQYVSSGLAAVIGAMTPVLVFLINLVWQRDRVHLFTLLGVLLGFAGLGLIFREGWADFSNPAYLWGILGCFGSCLTWSLGTVMAKQLNQPNVSPLVNAGIQISFGGMGGFVMSALFDTHHTIIHSWTGWGALLYLTLIGSALAFSLYMYILKHLSATAASVYTYINPVVAVFLGWLWLGEQLSLTRFIGTAATIAGVWLVKQGEERSAG